MAFATGANLPAEIIHRIAVNLSPDPRRRWLPVNSGKDCPTIDKRGLAACSLTCRHWAKILRPILFAKVTVDGAEDFFSLLSFVTSSVQLKPPLKTCIGAVLLKAEASEAVPWIHHVKGLTDLIWPLQIDLLITAGPSYTSEHTSTGTAAQRGRLPLYALPRKLPGAFYKLNLLRLENVQLQSDTELMKFVDNFPSLWKCYLRGVTFIEGPSGERRRRRHIPHASFFYDVEAVDCEDGLPINQLLLVTRLLSYIGRSVLYEQTLWTQILHATAALAPADYTSGGISVLRSVVAFEGLPEYVTNSYPIVVSSPLTGARISVQPGAVALLEHNPRTPAIPHLDVMTITFNRIASYEALPWDAFEGAIFQLDHIPMVVLNMSTGDKDGFKWLADAILCGQILNRLEKAGKLALAHSTRRGGTLTLAQVLSTPETQLVDGTTITLSVAQRFDLLVVEDTNEREQYVRKILAASDP